MGGVRGGGASTLSYSIHNTAKILRKRTTDAETTLWKYLRAKQTQGWKLRRQEPIGPDIVDSVCHENKVVIEVDGGQHSVEKAKDNKYQWGIRKNQGDDRGSPSPPPPIKGGEKERKTGIKN